MKSLKKLLLVIASMGLAGSAAAVEQVRDPDAHAAAGLANSMILSRASVVPASMNGHGSPAQANYRMASVAPVKYTLADAGAWPTHAAITVARPHSSANAGGMKLEVNRPADGTRIGLPATSNVAGVAAPQTVRADTTPRRFRFPLAAMPEPTEWMQLLCGLVVAGFIARRRTNVGVG
jgi:hypothetical protein